jgi:hypothetical protein
MDSIDTHRGSGTAVRPVRFTIAYAVGTGRLISLHVAN